MATGQLISKLREEIASLIQQRDEAREGWEASLAELRAELARLTRERGEAREFVERVRAEAVERMFTISDLRARAEQAEAERDRLREAGRRALHAMDRVNNELTDKARWLDERNALAAALRGEEGES